MKAGPHASELLKLLLAGSVVGPALIFGWLGWVTYRAAFADAEREIAWTSEVAREHASKVFDTHMIVAERVHDLLEGVSDAAIRQSEQRFHDALGAMIAGLPQIESLVVLDRDARLLAATAAFPVSSADDFSDRDYFVALKSGRAGTYISHTQKSRVSGKMFFGWGRSRTAADGSFDGVIDIAISPEFFRRFYETLVGESDEGVNGRVVTMIRDDGVILVRYPGFTGDAPVLPASSSFFDAVRKNPEAGAYTSRSVIDGGAPQRRFAFRKVPGHPVYVVAGRSLDVIVAEWRDGMLRYLAIGLPGTVGLFLVTLAALRGAAREAEALTQVRHEMRRRELVEDQLRQSQKMEAVGQLTGGIAHDFNNLLTIIRSSADLLRRSDLPEARRRRYVDAIGDTVDRAAKLTGQLLAFARRQALKPEVFDAAGRVRAVLDMLRTIVGSRVEVVTALTRDRCMVEADATQFETALVNMVVNARDAMDDEGRLVVRVDTVPDLPAIRGHEGRSDPFVAVSLTDTGTGIAPDKLAQIFEPFFTTKQVGKGTGLGLSQVYGFAKQSGGDVAVDSEVGRGTTFTLFLPRVEAEATPVEPRAAVASTHDRGDGRRVLVVEDNVEVGGFSTQLLRDLGYETTWAASADQALTILDQRAGAFDAVFSDVVMPGMSGMDLGRLIRERFPALPVVLTSGYSQVVAEDGLQGFELLKKPYAVEDLSRVLGRVTRSARPGCPSAEGAAGTGGSE